MPAMITVTNDQVARAAAQLVAEGKRVTGYTLRSVIGVGRPSRLLAVYQEQQGEAPTHAAPEPEAPALPPMISEHLAAATERLSADLAGLVGQAWARAAELATKRVQAEVDAARARVSELEDELAQADGMLEAADNTDRTQCELIHEAHTERDATALVHAEELGKAKDEAMRARADADAARGLLTSLQETVKELVCRIPRTEPSTVS